MIVCYQYYVMKNDGVCENVFKEYSEYSTLEMYQEYNTVRFFIQAAWKIKTTKVE